MQHPVERLGADFGVDGLRVISLRVFGADAVRGREDVVPGREEAVPGREPTRCDALKARRSDRTEPDRSDRTEPGLLIASVAYFGSHNVHYE